MNAFFQMIVALCLLYTSVEDRGLVISLYIVPGPDTITELLDRYAFVLEL